MDESKKIPGVGKYEIRPKNFKVNADKIYGNYTLKTEGGGFIDEAKYNGHCTPAPYQAIDLNKIKNRVIQPHIRKLRESDKNAHKFVRDNSPSPHTYKKDEAWEKSYGTHNRFTFKKSKEKAFVE